MLQPVGPLNPTVYWARRVALMVLAVVVLIGAIWLVSGSGNDDGPAASPAAAVSDTSSSVTSPTSATGSAIGTTGTSAVKPSLTGELAEATTKAPASSKPATSGSVAATVPPSTAAPTTSAEPSDTAPATGSAAPATTAPATSTAPATTGSESVESILADKEAEAKLKKERKAAEAAAAAKEKAAAAKAKEEAERAKQEKAAVEAARKKAAEEKAAAEKAAAEAAAELAARTFDDQGRLNCPKSFVELTAFTETGTVQLGTQPRLGLTVTDGGDLPCVADVSGSKQIFRVYTEDGTRVWSTEDCFPGEGTELRFLQPAETAEFKIIWAGTTSAPGCAGDRLQVPAGSYLLEAQLGDVVSARTPFTIA